MNIIAGKFRGKKMIEFFNETTRPTMSRVRENIFNVLSGRVAFADVLDLFAGTGLYGIEAISRGAKSVVFNDMDAAAISVIKKNLASLKGHECVTQVLNFDAFSALDKHKKMQFDIVFLDPPYDSKAGVIVIKEIINRGMLKDDGVIVFETDSSNSNFDLEGLVFRTKEYGRARIYFISL